MLNPGEQGISKFMHSFKKNVTRDVQNFLGRSDFRIAATDYIAATDPIPRSDSSDIVTASNPSRSGGSKTAATIIGWRKGFYDERIQTSHQRSAALHYVQGNAMKHGYVSEAALWPWTSLHFERLLDRLEQWIC